MSEKYEIWEIWDMRYRRYEIWEIRDMRNRNHEVPKKIELGFKIGLPINETQFSKTIINSTFFHIS